MASRGSRIWHGYGVLSQPLTIMGVERRFFLMSAVLGAALWNTVNSLFLGVVTFTLMYVAGFFAWRYDENMVTGRSRGDSVSESVRCRAAARDVAVHHRERERHA